MRRAVLIDAVRTPIGRYGGALKTCRPDDLAALVIRMVVQRARIDPASIEDVYLGATNQAGEDNRNVARMAALLAGLPETVAGCTVNRLCASGLEAVNLAARMIEAGMGDVFIAGGVESMSRAPFVMLKPEEGFPRGNSGAFCRYGDRGILAHYEQVHTPPRNIDCVPNARRSAGRQISGRTAKGFR